MYVFHSTYLIFSFPQESDKKESTDKDRSAQRSTPRSRSNQRSRPHHTDMDRSGQRSSSTSQRPRSHNNHKRSDQRSSTIANQPDQGGSSSRSDQSSTSHRSRLRSVVTSIERAPTEQARSECRVTFELPPTKRRRSIPHYGHLVYSHPEST